VEALASRDLKHLVVISNNAGHDAYGLGLLVLSGKVDRIICTYPWVPGSVKVKQMIEEERIELELVPQGTLAERIRAGGAGLGGILTPSGIGTKFAEGKQIAMVEGQEYLIEKKLTADFSLVKATRADRWGNLIYRLASRNFNDIMAMAGKVTIAQSEQVSSEGLPPEQVHTPGIFVDRVVEVASPHTRK
jgi:3-oxoadipate CoA-transferase, alpha subunit